MNKIYIKYYILIGIVLPMFTLLGFVLVPIPYTDVPFSMQLFINSSFSMFIVTVICGGELILDIRSGKL